MQSGRAKRWALWDEEGGLWAWGAVTGTKSPRTNTCIWISCVFLVLRFGPWFPTRFVPQSAEPQSLQDTTSKALAKEMFPAFQSPLSSWVAASHWAHDAARLLLLWA